MSIFKIASLELLKNQYLKNINVEFINRKELRGGPYFSVIIGPNGTGKSYILKTLIDIFREVESRKIGKKSTFGIGPFKINYIVDNKNVVFTNQPKLFGLVNEVTINKRKSSVKSVPLPSTIIATSVLLNDRFPFTKLSEDSIYKYLGIRRSSSIATTKTYLRRTIDHLVYHVNRSEYSTILKDTLAFLDFDYKIRITYKAKFKKKIYKGNLSELEFRSFFEKWRKYRKRNTEPYAIGFYKKQIRHDPQTIKGLVHFANSIAKKAIKKNSKSIQFSYSILEPGNKINRDLKFIKLLDKLDLISYPKVFVYKKKYRFNLENSSSGEFHLLATVLGVISTIQKNSVVIIDEPELSLHPNWQLQYIDFLRNVFRNYASCHFVIATHSHFMISDLRHTKSSIISLMLSEEGKIQPQIINANTFGWSAEQILLEIFRVPTTRNYFIADRIGEILDLISKPKQNEKLIKNKVESLVKSNILDLKSSDPLKEVINKLVKTYAE